MLRPKHGQILQPTAVGDLSGTKKGVATLQEQSGAGNTPHVYQNGREMDGHFCDSANSQAPPAGLKRHVEAEARPDIAVHSCWRLVRDWEGCGNTPRAIWGWEH